MARITTAQTYVHAGIQRKSPSAIVEYAAHGDVGGIFVLGTAALASAPGPIVIR